MIKGIVSVSLILVLSLSIVYGQQQNKRTSKQTDSGIEPAKTQLYQEIYRQDSIFFNAFNKCDTVTYKHYLTDNFEFYHDLGGLHYLDEEMQSMRELCERNTHMRRELLKGSLQVYKLGDYGALEIGVHRFYHTNPGQTEHISGTYKFINLWQKKDGSWQLSRVISYDHEKVNNN